MRMALCLGSGGARGYAHIGVINELLDRGLARLQRTFYEAPGDVHTLSRNASQTERAKFLVFFVKDKRAPILVPAK